jgi:hypothetical protein
MAVLVAYLPREDKWVKLARFEASGTRDALIKIEHLIPPSIGSAPVRLVEQARSDARQPDGHRTLRS